MPPLGFALAVIVAQAATAPAPDPAQLERIRNALDDAPAVTLNESVRREGMVFRVTIRAPGPDKAMWDDWSSVPTYIRPYLRLYQHEFLEQVTPEEFRAGTLFPVGIPVIPLLELIGKHRRAAARKAQEQRARDEVRQALEDVLACRGDRAKPGC